MEITNLETKRIAGQIRRSFEGPAWHGPSLRELLEGVTEEQARRRPVAGAHTIWELTLHVAAWMRIGRERLTATESRGYTDEENFPPMSGSWTDALELLDRECRALIESVRSFPDSRLNDTVPAPEPQTYYILLHGIAQHNIYHAGQIAILKK